MWKRKVGKSLIERSYYESGQVRCEAYYVNGQRHRAGGPAIREWYESGQLQHEAHYVNGMVHRTDGPAVRDWHESGQLRYDEYFLNGSLHRVDDPAACEWYESGQVRCEAYYVNGERHRTDGPAVRHWHESGELESKEYWLHGVACPAWLVLTDEEKIDPARFLELENVEQRAVFIRKVGLARIIAKLKPRVLDSEGEYTLYELPMASDRSRIYLKMLNPSTGFWHIEAVPPDTRSVREALDYRKPPALKKIPVSENGLDWYQQGDVAIWPRNAQFLKPHPYLT